MFNRSITLPNNKSFFLFGPRGTGKSTLARSRFPDAHYINLLLGRDEDRLRLNPDSLLAEVAALPAQTQHVIIDEIQKVPKLLDIVHAYLAQADTKPKRHFILTGSSARKLKQDGANLLAGRAVTRDLHPLTTEELGSQFRVADVLRWGSLPELYKYEAAVDKDDFLDAYARTYLREEIAFEQVVRKLEPFRKFLAVAAQANTNVVNFARIARDTGVDDNTIRSYFQILEDTWLGFFLEAYHPSIRKKLGKSPKFYFFDLGVARALASQLPMVPVPSTSYYGDLFEALVILECLRLEAYRRRSYRFSYLSVHGGGEIDLVVERPGQPLALVEIKSASTIDQVELGRFASLAELFPEADCYCLSQDPVAKRLGRIQLLPWQLGIQAI